MRIVFILDQNFRADNRAINEARIPGSKGHSVLQGRSRRELKTGKTGSGTK